MPLWLMLVWFLASSRMTSRSLSRKKRKIEDFFCKVPSSTSISSSSSLALSLPTTLNSNSIEGDNDHNNGVDDDVDSSTSKKRVEMVPPINHFAQTLGERLDCSPIYLTDDGKSWYLLKQKWMQSNNNSKNNSNNSRGTRDHQFEEEWSIHPTVRHKLKLFGRVVEEKRWSQSWGVSYSYSGSTNIARPIEESDTVQRLILQANQLVKDIIPHQQWDHHQDSNDVIVYNGCLQNWYTPEDTIGLHSDDERSQRSEYPIFSLSWGGTRRFLFRERADKNKKIEIYLRDGDLLVMGGTCQQTHYHEVPKFRKTKDPPTANRINFTIRAFKEGTIR